VMQAIQDFVGSDPMTAYNAKFDYASLDIMNKRHGGSMDLNLDKAGRYDILGAALWIKSDKGTKDFGKNEGENKLKAMYTEYVGKGWSDTDAHGAKYDTERTADVLGSFGEMFESGKLLSKGKQSKERTGTNSKEKMDSFIQKWKKEDSPLGEFLRKFDNIEYGEDSTYDAINDIIALTDNEAMTEEELKQELEHEISHQKTTGFWGANPTDTDVSYIRDNMDKIRAKKDQIMKAVKDPAILDRIDKFMNESDDTRAALEFIAIMDAEPSVRTAMTDAIGSKSIKGRIARLIKKIQNWFKNADSKDLDFEKVLQAVDSIVKKGDRFNQESKKKAEAGRKNVGMKLNAKNNH